MKKTETTLRLEELLRLKFNARNDFFVFECTYGWYGKEIVDCIKYNCQREITCYEIKQSVSDFRSKATLSFFGHKNYFVMPYSLYLKVKDEIPYDIGVYVAIDHQEPKQRQIKNSTQYYCELIDGLKELYCIKCARKQELKADREIILSSMLRSMQRELFK